MSQKNNQKSKLMKTTRRSAKSNKTEKMYTLSELLNTIKILEKTIKEQKKVSSCTICMDDIPNDKIVTTRCNHHFCQECFWNWCKMNNTCPNCREELMDKDRKAELELINLLDRRKEIRNEVQELYEECDDVALDISDNKKILKKLQKNIQDKEDYYDQIQDELFESKQELDELRAYIKDPEKTRKLIDKRRKNALKRKQKNIYRVARSNKKLMLKELLMGPLFEMNFVFEDEYEEEEERLQKLLMVEEEEDFSEAFNDMFHCDETNYETMQTHYHIYHYKKTGGESTDDDTESDEDEIDSDDMSVDSNSMPDLIEDDSINEEDEMSEPYEPDSIGDIQWIHSVGRNVTIRRRHVDMRNMRTIYNRIMHYQNIHNAIEEDYIELMRDDE